MKLSSDDKKKLLRIRNMKLLQKLHKKHVKGRGPISGTGEDFWGKVGSFISKAATDVNDFVKKNKVISSASKLAQYVLPAVGLAEFMPAAKVVGDVASTLGYGKAMIGRKPVYTGGVQQYGTAPSMMGMGVQGTISNSLYIPQPIRMQFGINQVPAVGGMITVPNSGPWVASQNGTYQLSNASLISGKGRVRGKGNQTEFNSVANTRTNLNF